MKKIKYKYIYEDEETGNGVVDYCGNCNKYVEQVDLGDGTFGCEFCKTDSNINCKLDVYGDI